MILDIQMNLEIYQSKNLNSFLLKQSTREDEKELILKIIMRRRIKKIKKLKRLIK